MCLDPCTWQGREYDNHTTDLKDMKLPKLDVDQWCEAAKSWGAKEILLRGQAHRRVLLVADGDDRLQRQEHRLEGRQGRPRRRGGRRLQATRAEAGDVHLSRRRPVGRADRLGRPNQRPGQAGSLQQGAADAVDRGPQPPQRRHHRTLVRRQLLRPAGRRLREVRRRPRRLSARPACQPPLGRHRGRLCALSGLEHAQEEGPRHGRLHGGARRPGRRCLGAAGVRHDALQPQLVLEPGKREETQVAGAPGQALLPVGRTRGDVPAEQHAQHRRADPRGRHGAVQGSSARSWSGASAIPWARPAGAGWCTRSSSTSRPRSTSS